MPENSTKLKGSVKAAYGLGAVGKDMVYMLSASYVLYYYQDILGVNAIAMGIILMAARIFDAFNDPLMGILVAKTRTRWGKFRPWLLIGTLTNAVILVMLFAAPPALNAGGLVAYAAIVYILWGVTYTMMDIPFWSMIPAFTSGGKEREGLTTLARSCAGVGSALITVFTVMCVMTLGNGNELLGFKWFSVIIAVLFVVFIVITCLAFKERSDVDMEAPTVGQMFSALLHNDQAIAVVIAIVLINGSLYLTSNLVIYFFKYDLGGPDWSSAFTLFNAFGGGIQILSMMILYPVFRRFFDSVKIFYISVVFAVVGYAVLFVIMCLSLGSVYLLFLPALFIFAAFGMLTVLTTVFLANTVDYGELKNHRRDESVIFSMQTFVVKLASGVAALLASICLSVFNISKDTGEAITATAGSGSLMGLRVTMSLLPIIGVLAAMFVFKKRYILTDDRLKEIAAQLKERS